MTRPPLSEALVAALRCPESRGALEQIEPGTFYSPRCETTYDCGDNGQPDLRLRRPLTVHRDVRLSPVGEWPTLPDEECPPLAMSENPSIDISAVELPYHISPELVSHFPKAQGAELALDLGCGSGLHRGICEHAGFEYVGLDYGASGAMLLGDAHALPFRDESFGFLLSIAVMEHVMHPSIMAAEALRVLKPGGVFIGTVAFLEPFHGNSFYHHTHLGTFQTLASAGFEVEQLGASSDWSVLQAQAQMSLFPKMPKPLARAIVAPVHQLHRLWWWAARQVKPKNTSAIRMRNTSGAFSFIARKPGAP